MLNVEDIKCRYLEGEQLKFTFFFRDKDFLSQWYLSNFTICGVEYNCMEQYMMAEKARLFGDIDSYYKILKSKSQREIKSLGRKVKGFDEKLWAENKIGIVVRGNLAKFSQNKYLLDKILSTGDSILVEASPYDRIWGVGLSQSDNKILNPNNWRGENLLGFSLMEVRNLLKINMG